MQAEGHTRLNGTRVTEQSEVPDSTGLGAKTETSKAANGTNCAPGLTEWLVRTLLSVSAEEYHRAACPATLTSQRPDQIEVIGQVRPHR
jgi:hypothetical protein